MPLPFGRGIQIIINVLDKGTNTGYEELRTIY